MEFIPAGELEERAPHKLISYAILFLWLMTFVMNGIAYGIYMGARDIYEKYYLRSLLQVQAKIILIQAISGILWFVVTIYIFISTLFFERREKYNIASGAMFLVSGVAEAILSVFLLQVRDRLIYCYEHFPVLSIEELQNILSTIISEMSTLFLLSSIIISLSIGLAFIFLGLGVRKTVDTLMVDIEALRMQMLATLTPETQQTIGEETTPIRIHGGLIYVIFKKMTDGLKKMRSGGTIYILSGVLDIASIFIPTMGFFAFILFIIGMIMINSGRKMFLEARRQIMLLHQPQRETMGKGGVLVV